MQNVNGLWLGVARAIVVENRDPKKLGRIKIEHPVAPKGPAIWVEYLRTRGTFDTPEINDMVFVQAENGDITDLIAWGNANRSIAIPEEIGGVPQNGNPLALTDLPDRFRRSIPSNRGLWSPTGHYIELDDGVASQENGDPFQETIPPTHTTESRGIRITTTGGNKIHISDDPASESIILEDSNGNIIKIDTVANDINISSKGTITTKAVGDQTEEMSTLTVNVTGGDATITASGNAVVTAADIHLNGSSGQVVTTETDPVVDTIFGTPHIGSSKVKAGP
jgi:hypothetical protein